MPLKKINMNFYSEPTTIRMTFFYFLPRSGDGARFSIEFPTLCAGSGGGGGGGNGSSISSSCIGGGGGITTLGT